MVDIRRARCTAAGCSDAARNLTWIFLIIEHLVATKQCSSLLEPGVSRGCPSRHRGVRTVAKSLQVPEMHLVESCELVHLREEIMVRIEKDTESSHLVTRDNKRSKGDRGRDLHDGDGR